MTTKEIKSTTQWMKFKSVQDMHFIGKGYVALSGGCHIFFGKLTSDEEIIYRANCCSKGDGVQCMAVHKKYPIFAFAEKCLNPRILLYSFPEFQNIKTFTDKSYNGYINLAFSEKDYLLALGTYPNFTLFVWNWRSGEFMASCNTDVNSQNQCLRWSLGSPPVVSQYSQDDSRTMYLWEFNRCYTESKISRRVVEIPMDQDKKISDSIWSPGGILYVVDSNGNIFSVAGEDNSVSLSIKWDGISGRLQPQAVWYKNGIILSGPSGELRLYHYTMNKQHHTSNATGIYNVTWKTVWTAHPQYGFSALCSSEVQGTSFLLGMTVRSELYTLTDNQLVLLKNYGNRIQHFDFVYPNCNSVVTLNAEGDLMVWSRWKGYKLGGSFVGKCCLSMQANPVCPYVALGRSDGFLQLVSLCDPCKPTTLAEICLCREELTKVIFTNRGNHILTYSKDVGHLFILKTLPNHVMFVMAHKQLQFKVSDISVVENSERIRIITLINTLECCNRGGKLIEIYIVPVVTEIQGTQVLQQIYSVHTKKDYLSFMNSPFIDNTLFAIPHRSRKLHLFSLNPLDQTCIYRNSLTTGHQCRKYQLLFCNDFILSCGYDGLIFLRGYNYEHFAVILPHHRADGGVRRATVDPSGHSVLSLGSDGHLIYTSIIHATPPPIVTEQVMRSNNFELQNIIDKIRVLGIDKGKSWLETQQDKKAMQDDVLHNDIKSQISEKYRVLKTKVVHLLEKNLVSPPEEKLPIGEFDLNMKLRKERLKLFDKDLEKTLMRKKAIMAAQVKLANKIRNLTWDTMDVKIQKINGFLRTLTVESYPIFPIDSSLYKEVEEIEKNEEILQDIERLDRFFPWVPRNDYKEIKNPEIKRIHDKDATLLYATESSEAFSNVFLYGSCTHLYTPLSICQLTQFENTSYSHAHKEVILLRKITHDLQQYFNSEFKKVQELKDHEIALLGEKNNRIQYVLSELNVVGREIEDINWTQQEKPEKIVTVVDEEVSVPPYISPSEKEILDKKAAEEEARRLAELADDFREKALIKMMDGVLELRWEDKIKRDIPKPKCLLEKNPENWIEDDIRAVRDYDEQVKFLVGERLRYRQMCEEEFETINNMQRESMRKFDSKLHDLHILKLKIEGCIGQELLKILRQRERINRRILYSQSEVETLKLLVYNERDIVHLQEDVLQLQYARNECHELYETLTAQEKSIDKAFKREFQELIPLISDQLFKHYRRHPKMHHRAQLSGTLLNELSESIVSSSHEGDNTHFMPNECVEYLEALDSMDDVSNAPPMVGESHWITMCQLRRRRIECELRTKSVALRLAEANNSFNIYLKKLNAFKLKHDTLLEELRHIRGHKLEINHNMNLQMVLLQGIVEVQTSGDIEDFENCVLICRSIIEGINEKILEAGRKKLKTMQEVTNFHRVVMCQEWEHKKLRMEIEDHKDILATIERVKVTRDMQMYLKRLAAGISEEQGVLSLDKEIAVYKQTYGKVITSLKDNLNDTNTKLRAMKTENKALDAKIIDINVDINEMNLRRDLQFEDEQAKIRRECMNLIVERSKAIKKIQKQHNDILLLQTELELLRLKSFPTLKYSTL